MQRLLFLNKTENKILVILSLIFSGISFYHVYEMAVSLGVFRKINFPILYFSYFILVVLIIATILFFSEKSAFREILKKILLVFFIPETIFIFGLERTTDLSPFIGIAAALYVLALILYIVWPETKQRNSDQKIKWRFSGKNTVIATIIFLIITANFSFSFYRLGKLAVVDEPLWTFQRTPDLWQKIGEMNWYKSRVSDKPGYTTALISGAGLLFEKDPKQYKSIYKNGNATDQDIQKIEQLNIIFRLPLVLFISLSLIFIYYFLKKATNTKIALLSLVLIGLSSILIGNSRIINPDGILWIFSFVSILAYFAYFSKDQKKFLYWSSFFLTLAILTKYTASIIYIFFFGTIFLEYITKKEADKEKFNIFLKKKLKDYLILVFLSLAMFFAFYPAAWEEPSRVLSGTFLSQPFLPIVNYFVGIILFVFIDTFFLKNILLSGIINFLSRHKKIIIAFTFSVFIFLIAVVFINAYSDSRFFDFEKILASPKSSYRDASLAGVLLTNLYPLAFGISPLLLISIIFFLLHSIIKKSFLDNNIRISFFVIVFIILYYIASVVSKVASTIRYQIILYPLIFFLAGIALSYIIEIINGFLSKKEGVGLPKVFIYLVIIASLLFSLFKTAPFYMGYVSSLLPKQYHIDIKDMGEGSYEAAMYINSLPDPEKLVVWTDKKGVCNFIKGSCVIATDSPTLNKKNINYYILSSGRESRTVNRTIDKKSGPVKFSELYETNDVVFKLEMGGRPGNYVKIVSTEHL